MNEDELIVLRQASFQTFKEEFRFQEVNLGDAIRITMMVRADLENIMCQAYRTVKDAHKKHAWLNQKLNDLLRGNSSILEVQRFNEAAKKVKEKEESDKQENAIRIAKEMAEQHNNEGRN